MTSDLHLHIVTRATAMRLGFRRYFTGKACARGHIDNRSVDGGCMQCLREKQNRRLHGDPAYREVHRKSCLKRQTRLLSDPERRKRIRDREGDLHRSSNARKSKKAIADALRYDRAANTAQRREWCRANPDKARHLVALRRARRLQATPPWLSKEQRLEIRKVYELAVFAQEIAGEPFHVDHVVPLKGKLVCGLHVPWNLQAIPARDNLRKHAKFSEESLYGYAN